jgi:predicted nucleic acid-binding protein
MLLDSNIIIYAVRPVYADLRRFIAQYAPTIVAQRAVKLRQQRKMSLGDAIIAGTALTHDLTLVTHNTEDFQWISGLKILDPLASLSGIANDVATH